MTVIPRFLNLAAGLLFVLAIPPALVVTNVRLMVFDPGYYQGGYDRHGVAQTTGLSPAQLAQATEQIQSYFRGGPPVSLVVQKEWGREPLFNEREQRHLEEVRDLMNLAWRAQEAVLLYLGGASLVLLAMGRARGARTLARWLAAGAGLTLVIFAGLGLVALIDFDWFWKQFHLLSFSSTLWMLTPETDYLIRLYPVPFWFQAVQDVIVRSLVGAFAALALALGYLTLTRSRESR